MSTEEGLSKVRTNPSLNPSHISNFFPTLCFHFPFSRHPSLFPVPRFFVIHSLKRGQFCSSLKRTPLGSARVRLMHSQRKGLKKVSGQPYMSCFREVSAQQRSTLVSVLVRCLPYGPVGRFALHLENDKRDLLTHYKPVHWRIEKAFTQGKIQSYSHYVDTCFHYKKQHLVCSIVMINNSWGYRRRAS